MMVENELYLDPNDVHGPPSPGGLLPSIAPEGQNPRRMIRTEQEMFQAIPRMVAADPSAMTDLITTFMSQNLASQGAGTRVRNRMEGTETTQPTTEIQTLQAMRDDPSLLATKVRTNLAAAGVSGGQGLVPGVFSHEQVRSRWPEMSAVMGPSDIMVVDKTGSPSFRTGRTEAEKKARGFAESLWKLHQEMEQLEQGTYEYQGENLGITKGVTGFLTGAAADAFSGGGVIDKTVTAMLPAGDQIYAQKNQDFVGESARVVSGAEIKDSEYYRKGQSFAIHDSMPPAVKASRIQARIRFIRQVEAMADSGQLDEMRRTMSPEEIQRRISRFMPEPEETPQAPQYGTLVGNTGYRRIP